MSTEPSEGAVRAAKYVSALVQSAENEINKLDLPPIQRWEARNNTDIQAAKIIDRETHAKEMADALEALMNATEDDYVQQAAANELARAALAKFKGAK